MSSLVLLQLDMNAKFMAAYFERWLEMYAAQQQLFSKLCAPVPHPAVSYVLKGNLAQIVRSTPVAHYPMRHTAKVFEFRRLGARTS